MKPKQNARQKREAEARRRKGAFSPKAPAPAPEPPRGTVSPKPAAPPRETFPDRTPEEEYREFVEYLDRHGTAAAAGDAPRRAAGKPGASGSIPRLNLEEGMPVVSEALGRMSLGLQEMRHGRVPVVKLIHGYGSTGRGGRIRDGVRDELAAMKRRGLIRAYIPGEDFGPLDAASRRLAERHGFVTRDPDYGRMNHGVTIVEL